MKKLAVVILLVCCCVNSFSQYKKSHDKYLQFSVGIDVYSGEIGGFGAGKGILNQWNYASVRPLVSLGYKYALNERWSLKGFASALKVAGNSNNLEVKYRPAYHRWFETNMFEIGANLELNVINDYSLANQVYVFAGGGATLGVKPKLEWEDGSVGIKKDEKSNFSPPAAPFFGAGIGYQHNFERWTVGAELFGQYHLTDFLEGLKSLESNINDMLIGINIIVSYNLKKTSDCHCDW